MERPRVGEPAPPISLAEPRTGERWHSTEHAGRPLVVIFHRHIH